MKDLDARLAAHYARLGPPADFDARLAARLAVERERAGRQDRAAALRLALAQHERARAANSRSWRRALWRTLGLGLAASALLLVTLPAWRALGTLLGDVGAPAPQDPGGLAGLALLTVLSLVAALPARWRAAAWGAIAR